MGVSKSSLLAMSPEVRQLHVAVMRNDVDTVHQLVTAGINVDEPWVNIENPSIKDGSTPLGEAVSLNHKQVAEALIQASANLDKADRFGCTPLHKAAYHGRHILTELLIHAGADVHCQDLSLNTPLHICVQNSLVHNNAETVKVLIRSGASVNATNKYGKVPLHYAALWGARDITEILLKSRADIDHSDLKRRTPLYCCIQSMNNSDRKRDAFHQHLPAIKISGSPYPQPFPCRGPPSMTLYNSVLCCLPEAVDGVAVFSLDDDLVLYSERLEQYMISKSVTDAKKVLIMSGCDTLNMASWMRRNRILNSECRMDDCVYEWCVASQPECLKQLCRVAIQQHLGYNGGSVDRLEQLPLPQLLVDYLCRVLL